MATEFSISLDGTGTDVGAALLGVDSESGVWDFDTGDKVEGTSSAKSLVTNSTAALVIQHGADVTTRYYDICLKFATLPPAEIMIAQLRQTGTNKAQVMLGPTGILRIRNNSTEVDTTAAGAITANQWFRFKWGITGSTQELRLYTDPTPANLFGVTQTLTLSGPYGGGAFNNIRFGVLTTGSANIRVDRIITDTSTWPTSGGEGNIAPTANAGPDQDSVTGGTVVTLNGTGSSDPDGTIASYLWTQTAGPTVTLSSTTAASPTFTAPDTAGSATFSLRVTDNDGAQSTANTVVITWSDAPTGGPTSDFFELLQGVGVGVTLTTLNTDFDLVDSGWTFVAPPSGTTGIGAAQVTGSGVVKIVTHQLGAAASDGYLDGLFVISDLSLGPFYILRVLSGSTLIASVRVNTTGGVQCRNGTTAVGTETSTKVVANEPFRVAWRPLAGGTQAARLYTGGNLFGNSGASTTSGTLSAGTFDRVGWGIGAPAVASGTLKLAIPQYNASTWPEAFGGSVAAVASGFYRIDAGPTYSPAAFDLL
jgi:hypothetical protein